MGWTGALADYLGADEPGVRLLLGQLFGYPLMILHRQFLATRSSTIQLLYFFLTGISIGWWVIGNDIAHSLYAIFGTYLILCCIGGSLLSVAVSFLFNFGYLLIGYWYTASDGYDICWTMPHCVLTLRLIGLTFDCYDGSRGEKEGASVLSKDQQKAALGQTPGILEVLAHSFFIGGYFVGPQFGMRKFLNFSSPDYQRGLPSSPFPYGFRRLGLGVMYMLIHLIGSMWLPGMWPNSEDFSSRILPVKLILLGFWCKILFSKYLAFWLTAEGVCIISGLSYTGVNTDGQADWKGCANVKLSRLETAYKFGHLIEAFNINTNGWVANYVYKRLKFLDNRIISQLSSLVFLSIWHGFHSGYHLTFFNEFVTMNFERELLGLLGKSEKVARWSNHSSVMWATKAVGWLWVFLFLPLCIVPFALLKSHRYWPVLKETYFLLYAVYFSWPLWKHAVRAVIGGVGKPRDGGFTGTGDQPGQGDASKKKQ